MVGRDIRLDGLTQSDEGHYITRDKTGLELEVYYFTIEGEFYILKTICHNFAAFAAAVE